MASHDGEEPPTFRVKKGERLFRDGEDAVHIHYLQKRVGSDWVSVFQLSLETGRAWGDEIDALFRHKTEAKDLLIHISGFGFWGDTEYYHTKDGGDSWFPTRFRRPPDAAIYRKESLLHV